jgi:uncharacterized protein (TIGR02231 family)
MRSILRLSALALTPASLAVAVDPVSLNAAALKADATIAAVTLYQGRAAVTRVVEFDLQPGVYDLQFADLPETIVPQTLQARGTGPIKVLGVEFSQRPAAEAPSPKLLELDRRLEQLQRDLAHIAELHKINAAQGALIDQITVRMGNDAKDAGGTEKLSIDALRQQIAFVAEQREKLMKTREELESREREINNQLRVLRGEREAIGAGDRNQRLAVVTAAVTDPSHATVELTYLVSEVTWSPGYNIRAAADGSSATIEYNALLTQRSGEDWNDVRLTLSTAQPMLAANPPSLRPWFVDVVDLTPARKAVPASPASGADASEKYRHDAEGDQFAAKRILDQAELQGRIAGQAAADASVAGAGPSVTFQLPRTVTIKTNAANQQTTRITTIDTQPKFFHVAVPALTDAVYIRGDLTNASAFQLLPGPASIFIGQDYVGPTRLAAVAPKQEFDVHFGIDPAVKAERQLVTKKTSKTGLFGGGVRTAYDYRVTIDNGTGKNLDLELWDRIPVSRNEKIKIETADLSTPLATDAEYVEQLKPQGMLKWSLSIPAAAGGKAAEVITYSLRVDHAVDVEPTALPE